MSEKLTEILKREVSLSSALSLILLLAIVSALGVASMSRQTQYSPRLPEYTKSPTTFDFGARPALANPEYFKQVRDTFIADKANFLEADLSSMQLRVHQGGRVVKEVPIKSKGREGSWWETPAGLYRIESKERNHFSSFGQVYQPWSMIFQGNFFIHGWPYYEDGTAVASSFSGGCIRLANEDARAIYEMTEVGTPVIVHTSDFNQDAFKYVKAIPKIGALNYLVADLNNNFVFLEKNSREVVSIASITKLLTALVASEYINLDKKITIVESMLASTSLPRLKPGEQIAAIDLLYPLLLESSNEAAKALAEALGEPYFVALMNKKAKALGMLHSTFVDPAGRDAGNVANAEDLFQLAKYLKNNRSFVLKLTTGELNRSAYGKPYFYNLANFNLFYPDPHFLGGKVGKTSAAGETMLALFEIEYANERRPILIVILNSPNLEWDVQSILSYVQLNYARQTSW